MTLINRAYFCAFFFATTWLYATAVQSFSKTPLNGELFQKAPHKETHIARDMKLVHRANYVKTQALWDNAVSRISIGDLKGAEAIFFDLLTLTPDFFPKKDTPPKILAPFQMTRRRFFASHMNRQNFRADIKAQSAIGQRVSLLIQAEEGLMSAVTEITIHLKTKGQAAYRSVSVKTLFTGYHELQLDFAFPLKPHEHLDYYVEFIGRYDAPFQLIGSPYEPMSLKVSEAKPLIFPTNGPSNAFTHLKAGWPILFATAIAVAGVLTYGLLKINR